MGSSELAQAILEDNPEVTKPLVVAENPELIWKMPEWVAHDFRSFAKILMRGRV